MNKIKWINVNINNLPTASGIYAICAAGTTSKPVYIGQAINLRERFSGGHESMDAFRRQTGNNIAIIFAAAPISELDNIERQQIEYFQPVLNRQHRTLACCHVTYCGGGRHRGISIQKLLLARLSLRLCPRVVGLCLWAL